MDSVCLAIVLAVVLTASDVRMRENYVTRGIPKTSYMSGYLDKCLLFCFCSNNKQYKKVNNMKKSDANSLHVKINSYGP